LFLIYYPSATPLIPPINKASSARPSYTVALAVTAACVIHAIITAAVSFHFVFSSPESSGRWADFLGIQATILASIQYFPQIWTTFRLKHVGSLSIPMMLIQTPGSFVWAASLFARLGKKGWSAWGVYVVTGSLQGCLLGMGIYFEILERRSKKNDGLTARANDVDTRHETDDEGGLNVEGDDDDEEDESSLPPSRATENTPLLRSQRG
jgi:PQ loop repeat